MKYRLLFFLFLGCKCFSQQNETLNFGVPIKIPLLISGSFGELRPNHFHAGTDFTANYKIGDPVYAPEDGVVNRIKVSTFGYGKALYIKHKNGYTTVYGHLSKYAGNIETYVERKQYESKQFELELFPLADELPVKKGDVIGHIGNTGGSGGPHLHYEIRNTKSENTINPLAVSLKNEVIDTEQPVIKGVYVYPLSDDSVVEDTADFFEVALHKKDGIYKSNVLSAKGAIGFGINTYDTQNGSRGKNGVYKIVASVNGSKVFEVLFDEFSFSETQHINQYIDYKYYQLSGDRIQKLFVINDLPLSIIKTKKNNGTILLNKDSDVNYKIEVSDVHNNKQIIEIPIKYKEYASLSKKKPDGKYIDYLKDYAFTDKNVSVDWDARTLYEDAYLNLQFIENGVQLHRDEYPVQKNINIKILVPNDYPNKEKTFIGLQNGKKIKYFETWKRENDFRIRTKELGTYQLVQDVENPKVQFLNKRDAYTIDDELIFEIEDDLSGIGSYNGYLNNEWVLFEYDYKTKKLVHRLKSGKYKEGSNVLQLEIADRVGNNTTFEETIVVH